MNKKNLFELRIDQFWQPDNVDDQLGFDPLKYKTVMEGIFCHTQY